MPKHAHRGYHGRFAKADTLDSARAREGIGFYRPPWVGNGPEADRQALLDQAVRNHSQNYGAYAEAWLTHAAALLSGASWGRGNAANDIIAIRAEFARLAAANEQPRP